jgi:hypothetical protein
LCEKGLNKKNMFPVYGWKRLSCKAAHNWIKKFSEGHSEVSHDAQLGCRVDTATEATVQQMEELS